MIIVVIVTINHNIETSTTTTTSSSSSSSSSIIAILILISFSEHCVIHDCHAHCHHDSSTMFSSATRMSTFCSSSSLMSTPDENMNHCFSIREEFFPSSHYLSYLNATPEKVQHLSLNHPYVIIIYIYMIIIMIYGWFKAHYNNIISL